MRALSSTWVHHAGRSAARTGPTSAQPRVPSSRSLSASRRSSLLEFASTVWCRDQSRPARSLNAMTSTRMKDWQRKSQLCPWDVLASSRTSSRWCTVWSMRSTRPVRTSTPTADKRCTDELGHYVGSSGLLRKRQANVGLRRRRRLGTLGSALLESTIGQKPFHFIGLPRHFPAEQ